MPIPSIPNSKLAIGVLSKGPTTTKTGQKVSRISTSLVNGYICYKSDLVLSGGVGRGVGGRFGGVEGGVWGGWVTQEIDIRDTFCYRAELVGHVRTTRDVIRETWGGAEAQHLGANVLFLVAGPWQTVSAEFDQCGDLFWIDMKESYREALTYRRILVIFENVTVCLLCLRACWRDNMIVRPLSKWAHLLSGLTISLHGGETLQPCPDSPASELQRAMLSDDSRTRGPYRPTHLPSISRLTCLSTLGVPPRS